MKAATGELNLTLITVIAIGAILAFFWAMWPGIKEKISSGWDEAPEDPYAYVEVIETDLV